MESEQRSEDDTYVTEWRIENLSHWCAEVHGDCIQSPECYIPCLYMQLYPKGIGGQGEHLVVRLCRVSNFCSGELSFNCSDGSLHCSKQQVNALKNYVLEFPPGLKFEDVLSRIGEDFITVKLRGQKEIYFDRRMRTTINGLKMSLKINPRGIEELISKRADFFFIYFPAKYYTVNLELNAYSVNDVIYFLIKPPTEFEYPFAVEMRMGLMTVSDDTVGNCVKKEYVFHDNSSSWKFPYPLEKKEFVGKEISLFLCLKTKNEIQSQSCVFWNYRYISIDTNDTPCLSDRVCLSMNPKVEVLTKDSGSQTSLKSDMPDDSVLALSNELMYLYQDQKYSDFQLKCDNVTFPVHKNILSARSPVLDRLLSSDMKEAASGTVDIGDLDSSTLSLFLTYLYTGAVEDLQCDRALKLYYAADKYQVPSLKRDCSKFLCSNVSLSNVCDILSLGDRHQDDKLIVASHVFILDNFTTVLKSNQWGSFMSREPLLAVKTVTHFAAKESVVRKNDSK